MKYLLILFMCATLLQLGACRKCYVCISTDSDQKCQDPFNKSQHVADECDDPNQVCLIEKISPTASVQSNVVRGCAIKNYCEEIGGKSIHCTTCAEDECNSSSMTFPCFIIIAPFLLINYYV